MSEDFVKAATANDVQTSQMREVQVNGENICLANIEGKYYAIGNICTHEGCPLTEVPLRDTKLNVRATVPNLM